MAQFDRVTGPYRSAFGRRPSAGLRIRVGSTSRGDPQTPPRPEAMPVDGDG